MPFSNPMRTFLTQPRQSAHARLTSQPTACGQVAVMESGATFSWIYVHKGVDKGQVQTARATHVLLALSCTAAFTLLVVIDAARS